MEYYLGERDCERLRALLADYEGGRLNPQQPRPVPSPLGSPLEAYIVQTTGVIPALSGNAPGAGPARVASLNTSSVVPFLADQGIAPITVYSLLSRSVDALTYCAAVRDPFSGQFFMTGLCCTAPGSSSSAASVGSGQSSASSVGSVGSVVSGQSSSSAASVGSGQSSGSATGCCPGVVLPSTLHATVSATCSGSGTLTASGARWIGDIALSGGTMHIEFYCDVSTWQVDLTGCQSLTTLTMSGTCDPLSLDSPPFILDPVCCPGSVNGTIHITL